MGGELVTGSPSENRGDGDDHRPNYSERFKEQFPYYIAFGMTPAEYWDGDPTLARDYRKAQEIRKIQAHELAWLNGLYVYEALCAASPLFRSFAKRGTTAQPYLEQPIPITKDQTEDAKAEEEKRVMEKGKKFMDLFAFNHNKRFGGTEVKQNGSHD